MHWIDIIGGIMLLLLGLRYLRKGFARLFGGDLLDWLQATAHSRTRAFGAGAVAGAIMPSSTAMAFLSVQLTREGKAPWATVFALLLGAQLGITALVHLLSLQITDFAGLFLAFGGGFFLFFNATKARGCGPQQDPNLAVAVVEQKKSNSTWLTRHKLQPGNSPLAYREILDDFQQLNRRLCGIALTYHDQANALDDAEE